MPHNKQYARDSAETFRIAITMLYRTVRMVAESGRHVVVDHVMLYDDTGACDELWDCVRFMHGLPVLFAFVDCPVEELIKRETARGDREIGMAERQHRTLLPESMYDITINTHTATVEQCAESIIQKQNVMHNTAGYIAAFERLYNEMPAATRAADYKWLCI